MGNSLMPKRDFIAYYCYKFLSNYSHILEMKLDPRHEDISKVFSLFIANEYPDIVGLIDPSISQMTDEQLLKFTQTELDEIPKKYYDGVTNLKSNIKDDFMEATFEYENIIPHLNQAMSDYLFVATYENGNKFHENYDIYIGNRVGRCFILKYAQLPEHVKPPNDDEVYHKLETEIVDIDDIVDRKTEDDNGKEKKIRFTTALAAAFSPRRTEEVEILGQEQNRLNRINELKKKLKRLPSPTKGGGINSYLWFIIIILCVMIYYILQQSKPIKFTNSIHDDSKYSMQATYQHP
jgi:hypothetical protein